MMHMMHNEVVLNSQIVCDAMKRTGCNRIPFQFSFPGPSDCLKKLFAGANDSGD